MFLAYLQGIETLKKAVSSLPWWTFLAYLQGIETKRVEAMYSLLKSF